MCECGGMRNFIMLGLGVKKKFSDRLSEMAETGKKSFEENGGVLKETLDMAEEGREKFRENCVNMLHSALKKCDISTESEVERLGKEVKLLKKKLKAFEATKKQKKSNVSQQAEKAT